LSIKGNLLTYFLNIIAKQALYAIAKAISRNCGVPKFAEKKRQRQTLK